VSKNSNVDGERSRTIFANRTTKEAGINDIAIYNLEGILRAKNPSDWFEIVLNTPPKKTVPTMKMKIFRAILKSMAKFV